MSSSIHFEENKTSPHSEGANADKTSLTPRKREKWQIYIWSWQMKLPKSAMSEPEGIQRSSIRCDRTAEWSTQLMLRQLERSNKGIFSPKAKPDGQKSTRNNGVPILKRSFLPTTFRKHESRSKPQEQSSIIYTRTNGHSLKSLAASEPWDLSAFSSWSRLTKGEVHWQKARFAIKGFLQKYGEDYDEIFAPVVKHTIVKTVLKHCCMQGNAGWTSRCGKFSCKMN